MLRGFTSEVDDSEAVQLVAYFSEKFYLNYELKYDDKLLFTQN